MTAADLSPDDAARAVGVRLRQVRERQGLSLRAVEVKSAGRWPLANLGAYERWDRRPPLEVLYELADWFGISRQELLFGPPPSTVAEVSDAITCAAQWHRAEADRLERDRDQVVGSLIRAGSA